MVSGASALMASRWRFGWPTTTWWRI